jgi:hypothetical protein
MRKDLAEEHPVPPELELLPKENLPSEEELPPEEELDGKEGDADCLHQGQLGVVHWLPVHVFHLQGQQKKLLTDR